MTDKEKRREELLRELKAQGLSMFDYRVGKYKPPEDTQWKPGQSGNPSGRPRGSKNKPKDHADQSFADMIVKKGSSIIQSRDGTAETTRNEAVFDAITRDALKGVHWAQRLYITAAQKAENLVNERHQKDVLAKQELLELAMEYKLGWETELRERARLGMTGRDPIIHPDDIRPHPSGVIFIYNLFTEQERIDNERYRKWAERYERELADLYDELDDPAQQEFWDQIEREIKHAAEMLARLRWLLAWKPPPVLIGSVSTYAEYVSPCSFD